ncbi:hypothetical protein QFZ53_002821 [Microbacterium natoriense]|uniref:Uncharacterized protein n=1 Tax=Microbacterium natoriense TaxID=284570 RepID=A0AAW8EYU8_9MICO|nr:hypothetical protein [Microbacterium natoriense]
MQRVVLRIAAQPVVDADTVFLGERPRRVPVVVIVRLPGAVARKAELLAIVQVVGGINTMAPLVAFNVGHPLRPVLQRNGVFTLDEVQLTPVFEVPTSAAGCPQFSCWFTTQTVGNYSNRRWELLCYNSLVLWAGSGQRVGDTKPDLCDLSTKFAHGNKTKRDWKIGNSAFAALLFPTQPLEDIGKLSEGNRPIETAQHLQHRAKFFLGHYAKLGHDALLCGSIINLASMAY